MGSVRRVAGMSARGVWRPVHGYPCEGRALHALVSWAEFCMRIAGVFWSGMLRMRTPYFFDRASAGFRVMWQKGTAGLYKQLQLLNTANLYTRAVPRPVALPHLGTRSHYRPRVMKFFDLRLRTEFFARITFLDRNLDQNLRSGLRSRFEEQK